MSDRLLTLDEAAQILRVKKRTVQRRIEAKLIRKVTLGHRSVRIAQSELLRYIHSVTSGITTS